jgi:hypothetical protein
MTQTTKDKEKRRQIRVSGSNRELNAVNFTLPVSSCVFNGGAAPANEAKM